MLLRQVQYFVREVTEVKLVQIDMASNINTFNFLFI